MNLVRLVVNESRYDGKAFWRDPQVLLAFLGTTTIVAVLAAPTWPVRRAHRPNTRRRPAGRYPPPCP